MTETGKEISTKPNFLEGFRKLINDKFTIVKRNVEVSIDKLTQKGAENGAVLKIREALNEAGLIAEMYGVGAVVDIEEFGVKVLKSGLLRDRVKIHRDYMYAKGEEMAVRLGHLWAARDKFKTGKVVK